MKLLQIGIVGLGLMGGSLAKAIKTKCTPSRITAYDVHPDALHLAYEEGIIDVIAHKDFHDFSHCHIIFLCAPVKKNMEVLEKLVSIVHPSCIMTDIGSTKKDITDLARTLQCNQFIGGHPMTGSEKSGISSAESHLYENAYYILTPDPSIPHTMVKTLRELIEQIGALPILVEPDEHDYITASISHVPHIIASAMVNMVQKLDNPKEQMHTLAAGGFKDITRIASSSPEMWQQICLTNKKNILEIMDCFQEDLASIRSSIQHNQLEDVWRFFERARNYRDSFSDREIGAIMKSYKITVDVVDQPGIIAEIATLLSKHNINIKNIGINNNREHQEGVLEILFYDLHSQEQSIQILNDMHYLVYL
ncbi:prephenate dehydrogenase [Vallitalea pronyensis]|uniref:Prephenate dehydrogenase n=1 Tax=Vallitalea pronyensis TaxID=1348613 RepID=A0A8J8SGY5_9FIRM|nr:prephenate dehydrogenase [Vallitalea pronyensis]QUI22857.1 prephenate dehydrogenase [Vallitalea pronyensis]